MSEGKHAETKGSEPPTIDFVRLEAFLTEEAKFSDEARAFMMKHAHKFAGRSMDDTHSVEMYEAYKEYQDVYEAKIMAFLGEHDGVSMGDFARQCKEALRGPAEDDGGHREFIEILLAAMEWERFFELMTEMSALLPPPDATEGGE